MNKWLEFESGYVMRWADVRSVFVYKYEEEGYRYESNICMEDGEMREFIEVPDRVQTGEGAWFIPSRHHVQYANRKAIEYIENCVECVVQMDHLSEMAVDWMREV